MPNFNFSKFKLRLNVKWQTVIKIAFLIIIIASLIYSVRDSLVFFNSRTAIKSEVTDYKILDSLNSADIARNLASLADYREQTWIDLEAHNSRLQVGSTGFSSLSPVLQKPISVNSTIRTRNDIQDYVVSPGDTVISLARDFDVSPDSIRWSNGIKVNSLKAGQTILIPPQGLDGLVYETKAGDRAETIAAKFDFSVQTLISFNDLEADYIFKAGERIFMPNSIRDPVQDIPSFIANSFQTSDLGTDLACFNCGKLVLAGQTIGTVGNTGWSTGPHLHLEIFTSKNRYNPWSFINNQKLTWPVKQSRRRITQTYHYWHRALDIGDKEGTDVVAIADGEILYRGCLWADSRWSNFGMILDHGNYYSLYVHLQAPNNPIYKECSINRRSQYGVPSINYEVEF